MPQQQQEGRGVLFVNNRKREGKQDPDYQGRIKVSGTECWLSAWVNTPQSGGPNYLALRIGNPVPQQGETPTQENPGF